MTGSQDGHGDMARVSVTLSCRHTFSPWSDLAFFGERSSPSASVQGCCSTYTSTTGWGAMCNGHAAARLWTGPQLQWNINCLQLLAVWLALRRFKTLLHKRHLLVRTNNTATIAYINHQGGLRSLSEGTLGTDALAHSWSWGLRKYEFPPVSLLAQTLCKVREDEEQVLLVAPYWPNRTWFPELMLLATAPPWKISLRSDLLSQKGGTLWHPRPDLWNLHVCSLDGTRRF